MILNKKVELQKAAPLKAGVPLTVGSVSVVSDFCNAIVKN